MTPLSSRPVVRAVPVLMGLLALSGAFAIKIGPGSPLSPRSIPPQTAPRAAEEPAAPAQPEWDHPTFELLVTASALRDAARRSDFSVTHPADLKRELVRLRTLPALSPAAAQASLAALHAALGPTGERQLAEARAQLERRAALQLASSRLARAEGLPDRAFYRLAFQVPGGQGTVQAVLDGQDFNPFRQGLPASVLKLVESKLAR